MSCVTSYGSCNGLVCVLPKRSNKKYGGGGVVLWNPALHEAEIFDIERPKQSIYNGWFGYDNGEYKLVLGTTSHLYLIRLNVDTGTWKSSLNINKNYDYYEPTAPLVHGTLHWPASYIASHEPIIIAYDLRNETVGRIATPDGMIECQHYSLGQVDGCLSTMFVRDYNTELWVMKEYGVKESWTKLMILSVDIMFAHSHFAEEPYDVELDDPAQLCSPIYSKDFYVESLISPRSIKPPRVD